jgi:hypothetical protein
VKGATWVAPTSLGVCAELMGILHGTFDVRQGRMAAERVPVSAIGAPASRRLCGTPFRDAGRLDPPTEPLGRSLDRRHWSILNGAITIRT